MKQLLTSLGSADFWLRLVYVILFALAWQVTEILLLGLVILQLVSRLLTGKADERLAAFGSSLSDYARQIGRYLTGAAEQKPWPYMEWPQASSTASAPGEPNRPDPFAVSAPDGAPASS